ncbi:fluoride efflux transporter FluC [Sulfoacidibacillus ferrooxidans]|uniref:Fluoride-specific ion channel FluC n=1 Tax=Sulfoacidibacillus ferrooxidans TaxID=2005001 RepID=A0A9X1V692_9BACL|nr:CrcB family protein [Sulfoacidibacillus ferrooxidans]MCI0181980.1 putative fluoride ion transporter CrcB [Sulfoacidibacillus ferrooxidans]
MNKKSLVWKQYLAIAAFAVLGALARQELEIILPPLSGTGFPIATLLINLSGAFFLAWFYTVTTSFIPIVQWLRTGVGTGFVGSYTTFSTFMVESQALLAHGAIVVAAVYIVISFVGGFAVAWFGVYLGNVLNHKKHAPIDGE